MKLHFVLLCVFLMSAIVVGQTFRGTILGTVTDPSGNVVAGATVKVRNAGTGLERTVTTTADGSYSIPELSIGKYSVTITQAGFQKSVTNDVEVNVATDRRVDVQLKVGQVTQVVEVSGEQLPQIETTTNELGGVLTSQVVEDLPVNGRDYTKLIFLNPGVAGSADQITDSPGSFGEFSMNGARGRSNNYLLDGTDMNDGYRNDPAINQAGVFGTPATILPIDAVAEVKVLSNFEPEYGRNAGAVVNIVTKSGTNSIHGSAGEYFRNSALDARNFFNPVGQPKAAFHNNQYGASLGGPIVKDKTFFYVDYEGQREPVGVVTVANVPTGNASDGSLAPSDAPNNQVIAALLQRHPWPAPNLARGTPPVPGALSCTTNVDCPTAGTASVISPSYNNLTSFIAKIDQNFNASNILTGRYFFGDSTQSFPLALTATGGQLPGFNTVTPTRVQLVSISYTHIFGTNKVNELRFGWNRFAEGFFPADQSFHPSSIGLCAATDTTLCGGSGTFDSGLPIISVSGLAQLGATSSVPRHRFDTNNQLIDDFSWKMNKHDVKFGFDFHRTSVNQIFNKYFRGKMTFDGSTLGNPILDFLAGDVDGGFQYSGNSQRRTYENNFGLYVQDSYRVTPHLTLNYGLRWDYFGVIQEKNNLLSNVTSFGDPTGVNAGFTLTQVGQPGLKNLYNPDKKDFAPRISMAWDVTGKGRTVVRTGFGMFFDAFSQDMVLGHLPYSPYYDPGPAYNNIPYTKGTAPDIIATPVNGGTIGNMAPVFSNDPANACLPECDAFAFDRNIKMPYMENYNLNLQQQISNKVMVQVGYVGSQGHRLWRFFDLSQPSQADITLSDCGTATPSAIPCPGGAITSGYGVPRRYIGSNFPYGAFYLLQENSTGKSNYNALQTSFRINGWHGVSSTVNFVWSRSMDNSSDGEDFEPNAAQPNDSTNPQLEYGPSNFNIKRRLTWNFSYEFPTRGGNWRKLKNGWGLDSVLSVQDGQPFHLNYNFWDDFSGSGSGFDRPDVVGPIVYHPRDPFNFLDLSSFAIPCTVSDATDGGAANASRNDCVPGTRHFGNMRRGSLVGPAYKQWDFAIYKTTALTERLKMQFRADFFNIINHPNFASPYLPAFIADAGAAGFALNSDHTREVGGGGFPLTATGDVGVGNPFLGGGGPRGIQLALKFTF